MNKITPEQEKALDFYLSTTEKERTKQQATIVCTVTNDVLQPRDGVPSPEGKRAAEIMCVESLDGWCRKRGYVRLPGEVRIVDQTQSEDKAKGENKWRVYATYTPEFDLSENMAALSRIVRMAKGTLPRDKAFVEKWYEPLAARLAELYQHKLEIANGVKFES